METDQAFYEKRKDTIGTSELKFEPLPSTSKPPSTPTAPATKAVPRTPRSTTKDSNKEDAAQFFNSLLAGPKTPRNRKES